MIGTQDRLASTEEVRRASAETALVPGAAHLWMLHAPDLAAEAIDRSWHRVARPAGSVADGASTGPRMRIRAPEQPSWWLRADVRTDVRSVREKVDDDRALARVVVRLEPER